MTTINMSIEGYKADSHQSQSVQSHRGGSQQVNANERLRFTVIMAIALHALIIFGFGFDTLFVQGTSNVIEVTLTHFKNDDIPEETDFLSQHNQQGSGQLEESRQLSTDHAPIYQDNVVRKIQLNAPTITTQALASHNVINTQISHTSTSYLNKSMHLSKHNLPVTDTEQLQAQQMNIASLQAKLNYQKQRYAKGPKVRQITSVSAKASHDAAYINSFREKIEYIGNKYYPRRAKSNNLEGDVQLLVALKQDGSIHEITLLKSSNSVLLDRAAMNSVRLAAPYQPFPKEIRKDTDILEIIRTWQFRKERLRTQS